VKLGNPVGNKDPVGLLREEIDGRCAIEVKRCGVDPPLFDTDILFFEDDDEIDLVARAEFETFGQTGQFEKKIPLGKGEVFAQHAMALEAARTLWEKRFIVVKPDPADAVRRQDGPGLFALRIDCLDDDGGSLREDLFINPFGSFIRPGKEKRQTIERQCINRDSALGL